MIARPLHFALACGLAAAATLTAMPEARAADLVIAVVDGVDIHRSDLDRLAKAQPQLGDRPIEGAIYDQLLDHLIDSRLVVAEARSQKLDSDPEYKVALKDLEDQLLRRAFLTRQVTRQVTDAAVKAHYDKLIAAAPPREEMHTRHILVAGEDEAKKAIADIRKGAAFADVAKKVSMDASKERGGDLGWLAKDALVGPFAEAASKLKPGEMTNAPVKTPFGWHVIKLEEKRIGHPSFDEVKDEVRADLAENTLEKAVAELRAKASIRRVPGPAAKPAEGAPAVK